MGVNHILGWYYGKLSWNRMWGHSAFLVNRFAAGTRKPSLLASSRVGFKIRDYKNGKEVKRTEVNTLSAALPTIEIDKDVSLKFGDVYMDNITYSIYMNNYRSIVKSFVPAERPEGDGALVRRIVGTQQLRNLDPFLMLDHFKVVKPHGFPDHPHRGFETVTYMIQGVVQHEDFKGHAGQIGPGDIQWMTAGKGIMHAEMPATDTVEGLQLWINLNSEFRMCEPAYQEIKNSELVKVSNDKVNATIIAGRSMGQEARTITRTPAYYIDFTIYPAGSHIQEVPRGWNAFVYVLEGSLSVQNTILKALTAGVLSSQEEAVEFKTQEGTRFVFFAGQPLDEPIVQYGPFVMNTQAQIEQTFMDYRQETNGFENASSWKSSIAN